MMIKCTSSMYDEKRRVEGGHGDGQERKVSAYDLATDALGRWGLEGGLGACFIERAWRLRADESGLAGPSRLATRGLLHQGE